MDSDLTVIADSLRRVRTGLAWFTGGCLLATMVAGGVGLAQRKATPPVIGLGGAAAIASAISLVGWLHYRRIESVPFYRIVRDAPDEIVWVYEGSTRYRVNSIPTSTECWVGIHLKNGKGYQLRSLRNADVTHVLNVIHQRAPHAVYGYSEAIAQQYLKDPLSLVTSPPPPESPEG